MSSKTKLAALIGLLLIILPTVSQAATAQVRSKVYGILTGDKYSGCMVQIGRIPDDSGLNCPVRDRTWVPLGCQGNWGARSDADRNLRVAQMAILTGDKITITISDTKKASGWCFGSQVILFR